MTYSQIIKYKKIIKSIYSSIQIILITIVSFILYLIYNNLAIFFIGIILGTLLTIPMDIKLEREIKEMEILLKLEKLLDRENNK